MKDCCPATHTHTHIYIWICLDKFGQRRRNFPFFHDLILFFLFFVSSFLAIFFVSSWYGRCSQVCSLALSIISIYCLHVRSFRGPSPRLYLLYRAEFIAWCMRCPKRGILTGSSIFCDGHTCVLILACFSTLKWPLVYSYLVGG